MKVKVSLRVWILLLCGWLPTWSAGVIRSAPSPACWSETVTGLSTRSIPTDWTLDSTESRYRPFIPSTKTRSGTASSRWSRWSADDHDCVVYCSSGQWPRSNQWASDEWPSVLLSSEVRPTKVMRVDINLSSSPFRFIQHAALSFFLPEASPTSVMFDGFIIGAHTQNCVMVTHCFIVYLYLVEHRCKFNCD